jgi:ABC-type Fe3+-siderophore transport system permease subunit
MFRQSAAVARQREVKQVFVNKLASPTVLHIIGGATAGEATVLCQTPTGRTRLSIGPASCYTEKT